MKASWAVLTVLALCARATPAFPLAQQIGAGDTALLFGGTDAEGGIGDWYLSNGVVEAIIDDAGPATDLVGVVPAGQVPPIQSEINPTGGTIIDVDVVGANGDQLPQLFTVGGLSTANFILYDTVTAPTSDTIRASGKLLFPPISVRPSPCIDVVTDYTAAGTDPFLSVTTTATNGCGVALLTFGGFLDAVVWTQRSIIPFSGGGAAPFSGKGFNHAVLDVSNPASALEVTGFLAAPGVVRPSDGIMDPANGTVGGEVSYGLVGGETRLDPDGPGGTPATVAPVNSLFGVSSGLITVLGNAPLAGGVPAGGTLTYVRHLHVGAKNDVRSVADGILTELAPRLSFATGTISGDVDAADAPSVEASILVTRIGRCQASPSTSCKATADCSGSGPCVDPVPGLAVNTAMSHVRTDAAGAFSGVVLPQGDYELVISSFERDDVVVRPVVVGAGNTAVTIPALGARGTVTFTVKEKARGLPGLPAKLTFKGVSPTADPRFHKDLSALLGTADILPETFGGTQAGPSGSAAGQGNVVYTATGSGSIQVRPGTYDVYASRGLEYTVALRRITVPNGGTVTVDFRLTRVVKTKDSISADFHVHSGRSLDTQAPLRDRVLAFAGEGVEVMVSTDHDKNVDYAPLIASLGLPGRLRSIIGDEVTGSVPNPPAFPNSIGHINAWPLTVAKDARRDGAIEDELVAPNWIFKRLRDQGAQVIQYNHPRAGVSGITAIGIFNNIGCNRCANAIDTPCIFDTNCPASPPPRDCTCVGYQPDRPITMAPNAILQDHGVLGPGSTANPDGLDNLAFDVIEIENGAKDTDFKALRQMRRDWFSLLNQGIYRPGTAVSDSHRITVEHAGWARTFVNGAGDDPAALDVGTFDGQVKAGNMVMTSGPVIEFAVTASKGAKAGIGGLVSSADGKVRLRIKVLSAPWIPVEEVRVVANGFVVSTFDATTSPRVKPVPANFQKLGGTLRFQASLRTTVTQDTYFVVEAGPKLPTDIDTPPAPPPIVDIVEPDVIPMAITNPIFIDRNGNAMFDPPGLPVMPASNTVAERPVFARVELESDGTPALGRLWHRLAVGMARVASRMTGEVVAEDLKGEMTGVTKEEKAEAARKGEYFPLHEFSIPADAVARARRAEEAAKGEAARQQSRMRGTEP
jgi:hypothetical protein